MTWIESHQSLRMHPKTRRLARLLGVGVPDAIGRLHLLWWWALDYAPNGDLSSYVVEDIAEAMMWEDGADHLIQSLITAGFLDIAPVLSIHHWPDYAGRILDRRAANATRQRAWRERHRLKSGETVTDDHVIEGELLPNEHVTVTSVSRTGATVPNLPNLPNQTQGADALREQAQIASHDAPPNGGPSSTIFERYEERLKAEKANLPGILGEAYTEWFARAPDHGRLAFLTKRYGAGAVLSTMVSALPKIRNVDDPLDYIQQTLASRAKETKTNGRAVDTSEFNVSHGPEETIAEHNARVEARVEERKRARFSQPTPGA